jgi:hypothetical protein
MTLFEFILVMVSLILAIGITQLLQGIASIVQRRRAVEFSWVPLAWSAYLFLLSVAHWWSLWDMREVEWTFPAFFFLLLPPTMLYLTISLLVNSGGAGASASMADDFQGIRVPFFVFMTAVGLLVIWDGPILRIEPVWNSLRAIQMVAIVLLVIGLASSRWGTQKLVAALSLGALVFLTFVLRFLPGAFGPS